MTYEELKKMSVQDVLDSKEYRAQLNQLLKKRTYRTKGEYLIYERLRENKLLTADTFVPMLCQVLNKESTLPYALRSVIRDIGIEVFRKRVAKLKAMCEGMEQKNEED